MKSSPYVDTVGQDGLYLVTKATVRKQTRLCHEGETIYVLNLITCFDVYFAGTLYTLFNRRSAYAKQQGTFAGLQTFGGRGTDERHTRVSPGNNAQKNHS